MEAKELKIGNWVLAKGEMTEVSDILYDGINMNWNHELSAVDFYWKDIKGIPLIPELLAKAGFTKIKDGFMSPDIYERKYTRVLVTTSFEIETDGLDSYWIEGNTILPIKHLHQLQNLYFALTGEELTINL